MPSLLEAAYAHSDRVSPVKRRFEEAFSEPSSSSTPSKQLPGTRAEVQPTGSGKKGRAPRNRPGPVSKKGTGAEKRRRGRPALSAGVTEQPPDVAGAWPSCTHAFQKTCPRCVFRAGVAKWTKAHGVFQRPCKSGASLVTPWLRERPRCLGGAWGIGCAACAHLLQRASEAGPGIRHQRRRWSTKWARFEVRSLSMMQSSSVELHSHTQIHMLAVKCMNLPDVPLCKLVAPAPDDDRLLAGAVPQLQDWLKAWRTARSPEALLKSEMRSRTDSFADVKRGKPKEVQRHATRQMIQVMAEVLREAKRDMLRHADHTSVAVDDMAPFRILRFRCCSQRPAETTGSTLAPWMSRNGILAVLRNGGCTLSLEMLDQDYSERIADSMLTAVRQMATKLGDQQADADVVNRFCQTLSSYSSDGGRPMRKCGRILQQRFPRLCLCLLDKAHTIRRAALPMTMEDRFRQRWLTTFEKRHALIPDLCNSEEWKLRLRILQAEVVKATGSMTGSGAVAGCPNLAKAVATMGFSKQRFDSYATPAAKFVALLLPIALLLAAQAMDDRLDPLVRHRSHQQLQALTGSNILVAGLAADLHTEVLRFTRLHDVHDHDISFTLREKAEFLTRLRRLFGEGRVLMEMDDVEGAEESETLTHLALRTAMSAAPIVYGDRIHTLWSRVDSSESKQIMASLNTVVDTIEARVQTDMADLQLQTAFACFDLRVWWNAKAALENDNDADGWRNLETKMRRRSADICRALGRDERKGWQELFSTVTRLLAHGAVPEAENRQAWGRVVGRGPSLEMEYEVLPDMVAFYLSIQDGECSVERDFSQLRRHQSNANGDFLSAILEVQLDGPPTEADMVKRLELHDERVTERMENTFQIEGCALAMTPFVRRCCQLWLQHFGRRFRCYKTRTDKGATRAKKPVGTFASVLRAQRRASDRLSQEAAVDPGAASAIPGQSVAALVRRRWKLRSSPCWNPALEKFQKLTESKAQERDAERNRARLHMPAPKVKLRPGKVYPKGPAPALRRDTLVADLTCDASAALATSECAYKRCQAGICWDDFIRCRIMVVDDAVSLEQMQTSSLVDSQWFHTVSCNCILFCSSIDKLI